MKFASALILSLCSATVAFSQPADQQAARAFTVTRMIEKFHVSPRALDDSFSKDLLSSFLAKTDGDRTYFLASDIAEFNTYATRLDDEIKQKKPDFINLFIRRYQQRLQQADSLIMAISAKKVDVVTPDVLTVAEDTSYPADLSALRSKYYKTLKSDMLDQMADILPSTFKGVSPQEKKYLDSLEIAVRAKVKTKQHNGIIAALNYPGGFVQYVGDIYCKAIAMCYDPHTEFFPLTEKENFESALGQQPFRFGFRLKASPAGGTIIDNLQPGSPAYKSGKLNSGDKIIQLQWEGKQPVDVSSSSREEISELLDASNHDKLFLTVKKVDGSTVQVPLMKERLSTDTDDRVKSFLLKGQKNIGYIYLPAFYEDWEANSNGVNGCANDVAREILKLKKENIDGLILDVRYNGGGSVGEAVELAGIFIDAGPVAQIKSREPKPFTLKDGNVGTMYDGPLVLMVNRYSASASELIAGTLQDYNRAAIVGSPTFGKATAQVVFPLDTTVTFENFSKKQASSYIKITISQLYRVNGTSAQAKGVQPNVLLPDLLDAYGTSEADEPMALHSKDIEANKYYKPYPALQISSDIANWVKSNEYFTAVQQLVAKANAASAPQPVTLSLKEAMQRAAQVDGNPVIKKEIKSTSYTVQNNTIEAGRLVADDYSKQLNDAFIKMLQNDAAVEAAYKVAAQLK